MFQEKVRIRRDSGRTEGERAEQETRAQCGYCGKTLTASELEDLRRLARFQKSRGMRKNPDTGEDTRSAAVKFSLCSSCAQHLEESGD